MMSTTGKDTSPYALTESRPAAVLSFCRLRMDSSELVDATDLFSALPSSSGNIMGYTVLLFKKTTNTRIIAGFLTAIEARPRTGPLEGLGKQ
jgi:hypothetical protein